MKYSVGIGTTNRCNFNCRHCYSREEKFYDLTLDDIKKLVENIDISSINFGTGENILNPYFLDIISYVHEKNIKMSLTSNGFSISKMTDEQLSYFHDIDISLDFANEEENDKMRGKGSYNFAMTAIKRLQQLGIECSIVSCLTNENSRQIESLYDLAQSLNLNFRLNIYKAVHNKTLAPNYEQFWSFFEWLVEKKCIVTCSEPIVLAAIDGEPYFKGCNCGRNSFRVTPSRKIIPCVYWKDSDITIDDIVRDGENAIKQSKEFAKIRQIPEYCKSCDKLELCEGGCASRRLYSNFEEPDPYCFKYLGKEKPFIDTSYFSKSELVHAGYLCTTILGRK